MTKENDGQSQGGTPLGAEGDLASSMVSTAIVPRLCKIVEGGGFDPYSMKHVRAVTDLVEQVEVAVRDTDTGNLKFQVRTRSIFN